MESTRGNTHEVISLMELISGVFTVLPIYKTWKYQIISSGCMLRHPYSLSFAANDSMVTTQFTI